MGIQDRDYMRGDGGGRGPLRFPDVTPRRPWWRKFHWRGWFGVAMAVIAVASGALWLARDGRGLFQSFGHSEGSLVVNINTASKSDLESLPGIGPALAQLIIQGRPYESVDDLVKVRGIGPRLIESLRPLVTTEGDTRRL